MTQHRYIEFGLHHPPIEQPVIKLNVGRRAIIYIVLQ